jgi:hypothetical protein
MIFGMAARVYPMFLLAPDPSGPLGVVQLAGLGVGVPLLVTGLLAVPVLVLPAALMVTAAVLAHLAWLIEMVRRRKRPALDRALWFLLSGAGSLVLAAALGLGLASGALAGPRASAAYAVLTLGGWVSLTIVGMMLKIVPFLVWLRTYAPHAGRAAVPTLAQLGWPRAEAVAYAALTAGVAALAAAAGAGSVTGIRLAGAAVCVGAAAFAVALGRILGHLGDRPFVTTPVRASAR